ncbi:GNAT family N-acetyltransferase [Glaciihabitans arcticus]|uniref:GNAT family N-acetyltransferase n=1 Tax=Glaciihabitans arcticus TaxID=2668039 RepID=UPI00195C2ED5|nr:GNAT family protein [Glaciihabitans arcticus]
MISAEPFDTPIVTDRLELRLLASSDVPAFHSYYSRPDVCRYLLFEPRDLDTITEKVAAHAAHVSLREDGDYLDLAVVRRSDDRLVGDVILKLAHSDQLTGEIGWGFHPEFQGNGYATEAATAMLRHAFGTLGFRRIVAELDPHNAASAALCRRLGMRQEAHLVDNLFSKGEWVDTVVFALLAREFSTGLA